MFWTCLVSLAIPVYAEVGLSTATAATAISTVPAPIAVSSAAEPTPDALPVSLYFKDGTKLEGRWRMSSMILELPQGPLQTRLDLLQRIEFATGTLSIPVAASPAPPAEQVTGSPAGRTLHGAGIFGGVVRRPTNVQGYNGGISFRPASERWEGRLEGGTYAREKRDRYAGTTGGMAYTDTHQRSATIKYLRFGGSSLIPLKKVPPLQSLIGIDLYTLRFGGGIGLYRLDAKEYNTHSQGGELYTTEPSHLWSEVVPHLEVGLLVRIHRRAELQLLAEFVASETRVAEYRYGGFSELLQLSIR